jgi:hypothetical protein
LKNKPTANIMFLNNIMRKNILLAFLVLSSLSVFGWGVTGHRVTGHIAEKYLSKKAKAAIQQILGQQSLAMASTWMDEVRSDSTYNHTSTWHWVTVHDGMTYEQMEKNPTGDIIMTLERIIAELKSKKLSPQEEAEHVKMLIHLVGDIHQPLHVGGGDDSGGNRVRVTWFGKNTNLHAVWDSEMIDDTKLSYTELAESLFKPDASQRKVLQSSTVRDWARESMGYRKQVYAIGEGKLSYPYPFKNFYIVRERLLQAGVRLAGVLNEIYG